MIWFMYVMGAITLGAVILAVYERRRGHKIKTDDSADPSRHPDRAAYTDAEKIRAEAQIAHPPQGGGIF